MTTQTVELQAVTDEELMASAGGVLPALGWIARGAMKAATTGALPAATARGGVSVGVNALEHQAA